MKPCHVVLILAGVYATNSSSIDLEIEAAKELKKPIIGIEPWGAEKVSSKVRENADVMVKWNSDSIVDAIRKYSI